MAEPLPVLDNPQVFPKSFPKIGIEERGFPTPFGILSNFQRDEWWAHQGSNLGPADRKRSHLPRHILINVRYYSNSGQPQLQWQCPLSARSGLMYRSKNLYSITSSAMETSAGGTSMPSAHNRNQ